MHSTQKTVCRLLIVTFAVSTGATPTIAQPVTADAVNESIDRAVGFLTRQQHAGRWPTYPGHPGGTTALCTLALLNAGADSNDPEIRAALTVLRQLGEPKTTYVTSLQTMVFCLAAPQKAKLLIRRNVRWLEKIQIKQGTLSGGWGYGAGKGVPDNSNSQFALLALHEAAQVDVAVNAEVWKRAFAYWTRAQRADGGWSYRGSGSSLGSMSCAGISSLVIAAQSLSHGDAWIENGNVLCCGLQEDQDGIQRGLQWLGANFRVDRNPHGPKMWKFYYLYGLERAGRLTGQRFVGQHDWYRVGAEHLVNTQNLSGSWSMGSGSNEVVNTAFAILFLSKGRRPVLMSKLKRDPSDDWNRHRNDIGNLTKHVETRWQRKLAWQITDLHAADVQDLLQSPILFLSGRDDLTLSEDDKTKLYDYINQGGFLFVENCCGGKRFDEQFRRLMAELFPDNPLGLLPPDHPVWYAEEPVDPAYVDSFPLHGVDACCRTSVVYCPRDLGCFWELARGTTQQYPADVAGRMKTALAIGANVAAYATDRDLRDRLDVPDVISDNFDDGQFGRGRLYVAKLDHSGGSDEAPAALTNLLRVAKQQLQFRVDRHRHLIHPTDPSLPDFPIAFVHGRRTFRWSEQERQALGEFLKNGGVIFGDAICASSEFADAFRKEIKGVLPDHQLQRIPPNHPMFTNQFRGWDLSRVSLRTPGIRSSKQDRLTARVERVTPRLEGIELDGRYVVIFSPNDISCALENHQSLDCKGYASDDAAKIGINVILYALQQ